MNKIILLLLTLTLLRCTIDHNDYTLEAEDIIQEMIANTKSGYVRRKTEAVMYYSMQYNIDPIVLTRLGMVESSFRHWKINKFTHCAGIFQINQDLWQLLLYQVDSGKLGKHIIKNNITNTTKYFLRIGYSTQMACIILRNYLDRYDGDYEKTLKIYGGWLSKYGKKHPVKWEWYKQRILYND